MVKSRPTVVLVSNQLGSNHRHQSHLRPSLLLVAVSLETSLQVEAPQFLEHNHRLPLQGRVAVSHSQRHSRMEVSHSHQHNRVEVVFSARPLHPQQLETSSVKLVIRLAISVHHPSSQVVSVATLGSVTKVAICNSSSSRPLWAALDSRIFKVGTKY